MTIHEDVATAMGAVLANSWSTDLPPDPAWPAIVYMISSEPEKGWVLGGGYDMNNIEVTIYARTRDEIQAFQEQVLVAMEALPGYMGDEEHGDSSYEQDPQLYVYVMNFTVRTRRTN
jgi:hypothetical protein